MQRVALWGILVSFILSGGPACRHKRPASPLALAGFTMGTTYSIKALPPHNHDEYAAEVQAAVEAELESVNRQMSVFRPDSEISVFNRHTGGEWFPVSPALAMVVEHARQVSERSAGAFDVTVAPLIDLWGFGVKGRRSTPPPPAEIERTLAAVGYRKLEVRVHPPALRKRVPDLRCNLSAIAKGYGVDAVGRRLEALGFRDYMVEIGGEVRTRGVNASGRPWLVGIAAPDESIGLQRIIHLQGESIATSGDYRNYFQKDGRRFSHTIDPQTAAPVTHNLASVSVIASSCMTADALATAIAVMGPQKGMEFARREKLPVFIIVHEKDGFREMSTPWFASYLEK